MKNTITIDKDIPVFGAYSPALINDLPLEHMEDGDSFQLEFDSEEIQNAIEKIGSMLPSSFIVRRTGVNKIRVWKV